VASRYGEGGGIIVIDVVRLLGQPGVVLVVVVVLGPGPGLVPVVEEEGITRWKGNAGGAVVGVEPPLVVTVPNPCPLPIVGPPRFVGVDGLVAGEPEREDAEAACAAVANALALRLPRYGLIRPKGFESVR